MVIKPHVPNAERVGINNDIRSMRLAGRLSDANSQLNRVISAASGADWRTLAISKNYYPRCSPVKVIPRPL